MKAVFSLLIIFLTFKSFAQQPDEGIPAFRMVLADGSFFSAKDIKKNKPLVLIYFAPDCDHCKALMKEFFKHVDAFQKAEVVMITFRPLKEVAPFINEYRISQYNNIRVGTEVPVYFIRYHYNLTNTPFTALFDAKGRLIHSYRTETTVDDLIGRLKSIR
jgi:thiol-disulfide isomerase/thioredoxin